MKISQLALPEMKVASSPSLSGGLSESFSAPSFSSKGPLMSDTVCLEGEEASESGLARLPNFAAWDEGGTDGSGVDMRNGGAPVVTQFLQSPKNVMKAVSSSSTAASALGVSRSNLAAAQRNPFQKMDSLEAVMNGVSLDGPKNGSSLGGSFGGAMATGSPAGAGFSAGPALGQGSMSRRGGSSRPAAGQDFSEQVSSGGLGVSNGKLDTMPTMVSSGTAPSVVRASVSVGEESALTVKKDEGGRGELTAASVRHGQAQETAGKNAVENLSAGSSLGDLSKQHGLAQNDFLQNALGNQEAGQQNMDMAGMLGNQSQQAGDASGLQAMIAEVMKAVQGVEKMKQAQAKATEAQGKATETQGKAIETSGQATEGTGVTTQANGVTTQATGVSLQATASSMLAAAAAAGASVFGAPAGAALAAAGAAVMAQGTALNGMGVGLQGTGTALQAQGKAQQATGQATQAAGQQTQTVGRAQHDQAKTAEEKAKQEEQSRQQMAKMLAEQAQKLMEQANQSVNQAVNNFANALKSQELSDQAGQLRDETAEKAKEAFKTADDDKNQERMAGTNRKAVDEALSQVFGLAQGTKEAMQGGLSGASSGVLQGSSELSQEVSGAAPGMAPESRGAGAKASAASTSRFGDSKERVAGREPERSSSAEVAPRGQGSEFAGGPSTGTAGAVVGGTPSGFLGGPATGNFAGGFAPARGSSLTGPRAGSKTGAVGGQGFPGSAAGSRSEDLRGSTESFEGGLGSPASELAPEQAGRSFEESSAAGFTETDESVTVNLNGLGGSSSVSGGSASSSNGSKLSSGAPQTPDLGHLQGVEGAGFSPSFGSGAQGAGGASQALSRQISRG